MTICPLVFDPIFKPKIWGGRRLESVLRKKLDTDEPVGESWELADLEDDQSVARSAEAKGKTLGELVRQWGKDLLGGADLFEGRFPLLIKFLDASQSLSVQVHPSAAMAARLGGRVRVKHEAWYVLHAEPDGCIYRGLVEGTTRESFAAAVETGTVASTLKRIPVKTGECYYLPSGTVHSLGAGVMVAEVQTPSDITYRVYDWDRIDPKTGQLRELHVTEALECIDFAGLEPETQTRSHVASVWTTVTQLVKSDSFVIERVRMTQGVEQPIPSGEMSVWIVLEGEGEIVYRSDSGSLPFRRGDTVLIPAALSDGRVKTGADCMWLEVTIPVPSDLKDYPRPDRSELGSPAPDHGQGSRRHVQINIERMNEQS